MQGIIRRWVNLAVMAVMAVVAVQAPAQTEADWEPLRVQAREMRQQSKQMLAAAKQRQEAEHKACWEKFLVSSCQEDAYRTMKEAEREAKRLDVEAGRIERRITQHEREERIARKAANKQAEIERRSRQTP